MGAEKHLASPDELEGQCALQNATLQENKEGYTMNINFKPQPEPQFNHSVPQNHPRYPPTRSSDGMYFSSRHVPHPRTVCHIRGLNNAPICAVKEMGRFLREHESAGKTQLMEPKDDEQHVLSGNTTSAASANKHLPRLGARTRRGFSSARPGTQHGEGGLGDTLKRIPNTPTSLEKLLKTRLQTSAPPATNQGIHAAPLTQPPSPFIALHYNPHIQEDMNYVPSYLDQGVKVLEKLCKFLQTDSLAEIQAWLSRASIKEKNFMSSLIHSELTGKDLLKYQPHAVNEGTAENMGIHSLQKPHCPLSGEAEETNQSRPSTKESEAHQNKRQEREENLSLSRLRNRSPAHADLLSPGRPCSWQSSGATGAAAAALTLHPKSRLHSGKCPPTRTRALARAGPALHGHQDSSHATFT